MHKFVKAMTTLIVIAACHLSLSATPYTLEDFAYSAVLSDGKTSLREVELPASVYEKMQRKDYGDLRVFSADGQLVPYQLSRVETASSQQQKSLVFYPFTKSQADDTSSIKVFIDQKQQSGQGSPIEQSIKITPKRGGDTHDKQSDQEYQYIIENPKMKPRLCEIQLDWKQSKPSMVLPLRLDSSDDLQSWRSLSEGKSVSKLNYADSKLLQNKISFPCTSKKYLRLTWLQPALQVHLQKVQGVYTHHGTTKTRWKSFKKSIQGKDNTWFFESDFVAGITKMEFVAPEDGLLYKGRLYCRDDEQHDWRFVKKVSQYRLKIGETYLQSAPFSLPFNKNRYWKVELDSEGQFTEGQLPEIRVAWVPRKLLFLAQGKAPFRIAFGNPNIQPAEQGDLIQLSKAVHDSGASVDSIKLDNIESTGKQFSPDLPWKLVLFWVVLIFGTLLMAYMVFKLYKQMSEERA
ncbi:MAG: hypothetical protein CSB47_05835 [Proteobacteria bacterium]|nr:MAG: hypothetical protein CSB47_05835 [Pseudomonadota bacterium]